MENKIPRFYQFGEFKLDSRRRILKRNDGEVPISAKNYDLLFALLQNEGKILSHDELLDLVWGETFVEQSNLKKGISALRQILGETPESSRYIKTIPRRGYAFISRVQMYSDEQTEEQIHVTATEIIIEEEIIDDDEPQVSTVKSLPEKPISTWQKLKLPIFASLVFLTVCAAFMWFWKGRNSAENLLKLENLKIQRISTNGNVQEAAISPDGKFFVYALLENSTKQSLWMRKIGTMNPLQLVSPSEVDFRSINISPDGNYVFYATTISQTKTMLYAIPIFGGTPRKIVEDVASEISFSPDGKRISFVRDNPNVGRDLINANADDGSEEKVIFSVIGDNHGLISPKWSPDGTKFVFIASETLPTGRIWKLSEVSANGDAVRNIIEPRKGKIFGFDWVKNGSSLLMNAEIDGVKQPQLWNVNYATGEVSRLTNDIIDYKSVSLSKDGNSVLAIQNERKGDLWNVDLANFNNQTQISCNINFPNRFIILPDNSFLAESNDGGQQTLSVINAAGTNSQPFLPQANNDRTPSLSADGKSILFISRRSGADQVWKSDTSGRNAVKLTDEKTFVFYPRFSPDGKSVFFERYNGTRFQVVKMSADGGEATPFVEENSTNYDFSPDGKQICYASFDETNKKWQAKIRNLANISLEKTFDISPATFLRFTPDGKNLIFTVSDIQFEGGNMWIQPLDGTAAKPLIEPANDKIYWVDFSSDGKKLYYTRGQTNSSIVLLSNETTK